MVSEKSGKRQGILLSIVCGNPEFTNKNQEAIPFPSVDHKAAMDRRESMANTRHKLHK